ncbi:hypothetical protein [Aestuariibaculum sediminum]|uniref:SbsA Ig-like domain-containing protein n=1 Tax=Aestuariibaculum sediminum TaxID=2770637 RepID=A0A8J6UBI7_9FLAO|nr:hypothetical protein [Aestuariibaculum sediminum]MBD0830864.1 hypothetical protein [Aestuariibaculum sediminum]
MNRTKYLILCVLGLISFLGCSTDENDKIIAVNPYVRFNFLVNSNNSPLEYPAVSGNLIPKDQHTVTSLKTLKIPVALSTLNINEQVNVTFSHSLNANNTVLSVTPANNTLTFNANKLTDTIYVNFNERIINNETITFNLESVSEPSIHIGNFNSEFKNDSFSIDFAEIITEYRLENNREVITGEAGETIDFKVLFSNGFIQSEIESTPIFEFLNGFKYSIEPIEYDSNKAYISYRVTLNESINNDDVYYESLISLVETELYALNGTSKLQIVKPIKTDRNVDANPAANFYDLSDPFYRTYGEVWNDFNDDGICQWSSFNAFTYPIVVESTDPNAILYDDMGTTDPSDDIYHHAFQIGFNSPNAGRTTNSFNLKRWFGNESSDFLNSPGFNISPALEFYPENGESKTKGNVLIIPQYLTIGSRDGVSYEFAISGNGTYEQIATGLFEIVLQLNLTNQDLLGGTVTAEYRIYNNNSYTDPENITTTNCLKEYEL